MFKAFSSVSIANFEQANADWVKTRVIEENIPKQADDSIIQELHYIDSKLSSSSNAVLKYLSNSFQVVSVL